MSDIYYLMSYYVKVCQKCLSLVSIIVIFCQTCFGLVVAQDAEVLVWWLWEDWFVEDIVSFESSDVWNSLDIVSDIIWQDQSMIVDVSADKLIEAQSGINISPDVESWIVSNVQSGIWWSGVSDSFGELFIPDVSQSPIWQQMVEQNLPEIAYSSDTNASQDEIMPLVLMTSFTLPNPSPQLSITEVRIDGTDEYIELTNRWGNFVWPVSISGIKTSWLLNVMLDLWTNESVVIGDTLVMVTWLWFDVISNQWLSMTDTAARSLQLIYSWEVIDTLELSATQILWSDNQFASREYDFIQKLRQVTTFSHNANIASWHRGNPWLVWWLNLPSSVTWSANTGDISAGMVITWTITTWVIITWDSASRSVQISQVYPFSDCVGEHIVLSFFAPYSWSLTIAWLGTSDSSKTFDVSAHSWSIWYVVESMSGVLSDNVIVVSAMTLTDNWESLVVMNWSGLILDSIAYSSTQIGKASMFTSTSWEVRIFNTDAPIIMPSSCSQSRQVAQIGWCRINATDEQYNTWSFSVWFVVSGNLISQWCSNGSRLVDWVVATTGSCLLWKSFAPWAHRIIYQQYSGSVLLCEDEYMFYGAIHQSVMTNTLTVASSSSYYEALYRKWKLNYDELVKGVEYVGLVVTDDNNVYWTCDQSILSWDRLASMYDSAKPISLTHIRDSKKLMITSVVSDGTGRDSDGTEVIEFVNQTQESIDLSNLTIVVNNRKLVDLTGSIWPKSYSTLVDYFPLPNSAWCVSIYWLDGEVYDEVCYGKFEENQMIDIELLKVPKKKISIQKQTITWDLITKKTCLQLEEYELLELDIREQKLINKAQKLWYQKSVQKMIDLYRQRSDQLYQTYISITDKKQQYIEKQKQYIEVLQWQLKKSRQYANKITELYRSAKLRNVSLTNDNMRHKQEQNEIKSAYPAIYQDMQWWWDDWWVVISNDVSWRDTLNETITNLF